MRKRIASVVLFAILLAGCVSTPPVQEPQLEQKQPPVESPYYLSQLEAPWNVPCYDSNDLAMQWIARYSRCTVRRDQLPAD